MPRIALPELEDQTWCPASLRDAMTDFLRGAFHLLGQYRPAAPLLVEALESSSSEHLLVDLASGAGGPWPGLLREIDRLRDPSRPPVRVLLTDLYPNHSSLEHLVLREPERLARVPTPVDARNVPGELVGLRTVFTAFHHFDPNDARKILANAADSGEPIIVLEVTHRSPLAILVLALSVVPLALLLTPFLRPFRWSRIFWTYLVPFGPLAAAWDGVASCLRSYRADELRDLAASVRGPDWEWTVREIRYWKGWAPVPITVLAGRPTKSRPRAEQPGDSSTRPVPDRTSGSGAAPRARGRPGP